MKTRITSTLFDTLVCSKCGAGYPASSIATYATCCNRPLLTSYHLGGYSFEEIIKRAENSMWRYASLLPVFDRKNIISLNEGMTPIIPFGKLSAKYACSV